MLTTLAVEEMMVPHPSMCTTDVGVELGEGIACTSHVIDGPGVEDPS
jgi:hypothetical protein